MRAAEATAMKIKVESEKLVKAVKKLEGIEVVVENTDDAREALDLILRKIGLMGDERLKEMKVTSLQRYETSAVNYKLLFVLEFAFAETAPSEERVALIKQIQDFFARV